MRAGNGFLGHWRNSAKKTLSEGKAIRQGKEIAEEILIAGTPTCTTCPGFISCSATRACATCGRMFVDVIRRRPDDQNSEPPTGHVLLVRDVLVERDEHVELLFSLRERFAVLLASEARVSHSWPSAVNRNLTFQGMHSSSSSFTSRPRISSLLLPRLPQ